jgi:hypothetical protein
MNKLNLSSYGVEELSKKEMLDVEGGLVDPTGVIVGLIVGWVVDSVYQAITGESITDTGASILKKAWETHIEIMENNPMAFK